jgi:hypothetical protein
MATADEPGVTSTRVAVSGPYGASTSHATAPPASTADRNNSRRKRPAPELLLRTLLRLRLAILPLWTLPTEK